MIQRWVLQSVVLTALTAAVFTTQSTRADTVLITGANAGLGLEFVKEYAVKGWDVIATHRRSETPESLAMRIKELISSPESYDKFRVTAWERAKTFHWSKILPPACDWLEQVASQR